MSDEKRLDPRNFGALAGPRRPGETRAEHVERAWLALPPDLPIAADTLAWLKAWMESGEEPDIAEALAEAVVHIISLEIRLAEVERKLADQG